MSRFTLKLAAACVVAGMLSPLGAFASSTGLDETPSRVVHYGDLDLNRQAGVAALYSRIKSAAREVCEPVSILNVKLLHERYFCRQDALARAIAEVDSPALTNYYSGKVKGLSQAE